MKQEKFANEEWDLYTRDGRFLQRIRRGVKVPPSCYHNTVEVVATDGAGHILLTRRAISKRNGGGKYEFPAGSVKAGEAIPSAARRELAEETGLEAGPLVKLGDCLMPGMRRHIYLTTIPDLLSREIHLQEDETMGYRFVTYDDWLRIIAAGEYDETRLPSYSANIYAQIRTKAGAAEPKGDENAAVSARKKAERSMFRHAAKQPAIAGPNI